MEYGTEYGMNMEWHTVDFISLQTLWKREHGPCPMQMYWAQATLTLL